MHDPKIGRGLFLRAHPRARSDQQGGQDGGGDRKPQHGARRGRALRLVAIEKGGQHDRNYRRKLMDRK